MFGIGKALKPAMVTMLIASAAVASSAQAQQIYSCTDANGKRLTSDRPLPECAARDQRVLNADGSVKKVLSPTLTAEEATQQEARDRAAAAARSAHQDAVRRDRNLTNRFPSEEAHAKARADALNDVRKAVESSERRMAVLAGERKPLMSEAEFYVGKPLPLKLKQALDANDATTDAQRTLIQNQQVELVRINALYDAELARLRRLWGGAPAGSMGPVATTAAASAPVKKK
jgi:Domain of unknown function (DUF4124)